MGDTSIQFRRDGRLLFRAGDAFDHYANVRQIVVTCTATTLTLRPRRWYDSPRLWLRGLWRRLFSEAPHAAE